MMTTFCRFAAVLTLALAGSMNLVLAQENPADPKPEEKPAPKTIWAAAVAGDIEAIKGFLAKENKIDDQNRDGYSILHAAIRKGKTEVVTFALANGANVNLRSKSKKSPLHYAAQYNQLAAAKLLVEAKADLTVKDKRGRTALDLAQGEAKRELAKFLRSAGMKSRDDEAAAKSIFVAAKIGSVEAIKKHLAAGVDVNAKNKSGYAALHFAASAGQVDAVAALIEAKADVALADKVKRTALHYAVSNKHQSTAALLLDKGAPVNAKDKNGKTPLDRATGKSRAALAELLRSKGGKTAKELLAAENIFIAAEVGDLESINKLLAGGADVNAKNKGGYTLLHLAVRNGKQDAAALLLEKGAKVNAERRGKTALDFAGENEALAKLLREKGGLTSKEIQAAGSIFTAAANGLVDAVKKHLAAGADVNAKNKSGYTALHLSAKRGHDAVAAVLLEAKADVALASRSGKTALHYVADYNGNLDLAKRLIAGQAPINTKDGRKRTPLDYAQLRKRAELAELLRSNGGKTSKELAAAGSIFAAAEVGDLEALNKLLAADGADVNATNKSGYTALQLAVRKGQQDAAALLLEKGANVNAQRKGRTPLDFAGKNTELAALLRAKGGLTRLELRAEQDILYAAANGYAEAILRYIEKGGDVNKTNRKGYSALHFAANSGYVEVVRVLVANKIEVDAAANRYNKTGLHYAARHGRKEIATLLLDKGANVNAVDRSGRTPVDIAEYYRRSETAELLRERGGKRATELNSEEGNGDKPNPQPLMIDDELGQLTGEEVALTLTFGQAGPGLVIDGWPGERYLIEVSSDLINWIGVEEVDNAEGSVNWVDPRGELVPGQFYRVQILD